MHSLSLYVSTEGYALETFLIQNFSLLKKDCILVDLTNANKDKKDLKSTIASIGISYDRWVKALNDTGAIQELQHHAGGKSRFATNVCGPNEDCVQEVVELSKVLGYTAKVVPIDQYNHLKITQQTIGWEWIHATAFMVALYALVFTYVIVQASGRPRFEWYTVLGRHLNKTFAFTATWGFAFSLLPGTLMRLIRIVNSSWTPKVLVWGCTIRKHIGLLALYFLFLHACMSVLLFGGEYFGFMFEDGTLEWEAEASMVSMTLSRDTQQLLHYVPILSLSSLLYYEANCCIEYISVHHHRYCFTTICWSFYEQSTVYVCLWPNRVGGTWTWCATCKFVPRIHRCTLPSIALWSFDLTICITHHRSCSLEYRVGRHRRGALTVGLGVCLQLHSWRHCYLCS